MAKYYLAGPFWIEGCQQFFEKFIERINETKMDNKRFVTNTEISESFSYGTYPGVTESYVVSNDSYFSPGHFEINFQKIRSEYGTSDMKRVLKQVLDLDLDMINNCDSMMAYIKDQDLGTLVEIGYFIGRCSDFSTNPNILRIMSYLKSHLLFEGYDEKIFEAIPVIVKNVAEYISVNFDDSGNNNESVYVIDGINSILNWNNTKKNKKFSLAAIRLGNFNEPINAMMAGLFYSRDIPFLTYTTDESVKNNVMMIAASLGHMNLNSTKLDKVERSALNWLENIGENIWSNDSIESSKEIK